mgnify:CR=1 FL=1
MSENLAKGIAEMKKANSLVEIGFLLLFVGLILTSMQLGFYVFMSGMLASVIGFVVSWVGLRGLLRQIIRCLEFLARKGEE